MSVASATAPQIVFGADSLRVADPRLFGRGSEPLARIFARRVLAFPETRALALSPDHGAASIRFERLPEPQRRSLLLQLAAAVGGQGREIDETQLPPWREGADVTLRRYGDLVSTLEIKSESPGRLQLRHDDLGADGIVARAVEQVVRQMPGVSEAAVGRSSGILTIRFDSSLIDRAALIRVVETQVARAKAGFPVAAPIASPKLHFATATLGVAAVSELALPAVAPLAIGLLVVSNAGQFKGALQQLGQGKVGLPVLYTALLGCSITTGQYVAHALMDWSIRYWDRRWKQDAARESGALLEETLPLPGRVRVLDVRGEESLIALDQLAAGDRVRVLASEVVPADGQVAAGVALVKETAVAGATTPVRKHRGDPVYAGSTVLSGRLELVAERIGQATRVSQVAHSLIRTVTAMPRNPGLRSQSERLAERAVLPTFGTAGVGYLWGDLFTVGAILHQDYASGAGIAVPLQTLRDVRHAARRGAVVREADALQRLAESGFVVIDDQPELMSSGFEIAEIQTRQQERAPLLSCLGSAGLCLGDARGSALLEASRMNGLTIHRPEVLAVEQDAITVRLGKRTIVLRNLPVGSADTVPSLSLYVDGVELAWVRFAPGKRPVAAAAVAALRDHGCQVFLMSGRSEAETAALGQSLGVDFQSGELSAAQKISFLHGLRRRSVRATYVGHCSRYPERAEAAHVAVSFAESPWPQDDSASDVTILGASLEPLSELVAMARAHDRRVRGTFRSALVPNLMCVAGAFAGVLNGTTAGILANVGVYGAYRRARQSLQDTETAKG